MKGGGGAGCMQRKEGGNCFEGVIVTYMTVSQISEAAIRVQTANVAWETMSLRPVRKA